MWGLLWGPAGCKKHASPAVSPLTNPPLTTQDPVDDDDPAHVGTVAHCQRGQRDHEEIAYAAERLPQLVARAADRFERSGRGFETWSGMLGELPPQAAVHRLDAGREALLGPKRLSAADHTPRAPHFVARPARHTSRTSRSKR